MNLYIDIDSCPVFSQVLRVAQRHSLELYVITRDYLNADTNVHLILAQEDCAGVQEWVASNIRPDDICVTDDRKLASNCMARGALALGPTGSAWASDLEKAAGAAPVPGSSRADCDPAIFAKRLEAAIASARWNSCRQDARRARISRAEPTWEAPSFRPPRIATN
jgi:hypothetical protein